VAETVTDTHRTIDAIWRIEQAKLIAVLARIVRDVGLAEDLAQGRTRRRTRTVIQVKYPGEGATPDRAPSTTSIPDLYGCRYGARVFTCCGPSNRVLGCVF
jgi:hypothetical protein